MACAAIPVRTSQCSCGGLFWYTLGRQSARASWLQNGSSLISSEICQGSGGQGRRGQAVVNGGLPAVRPCLGVAPAHYSVECSQHSHLSWMYTAATLLRSWSVSRHHELRLQPLLLLVTTLSFPSLRAAVLYLARDCWLPIGSCMTTIFVCIDQASHPAHCLISLPDI